MVRRLSILGMCSKVSVRLYENHARIIWGPVTVKEVLRRVKDLLSMQDREPLDGGQPKHKPMDECRRVTNIK